MLCNEEVVVLVAAIVRNAVQFLEARYVTVDLCIKRSPLTKVTLV